MESQTESPRSAQLTHLARYEGVQRSYEARTPTSRSLYEAATRDLPGGETRTSTFFLPHPLFMARGEGQYLFDRDDNQYLDFLGNYTSLVHGHAHPAITKAMTAQLSLGTAHGACTEGQNHLAALIKSRMPSIQRIRFTNSGTEAVMQAVRTARAWTGRPLLAKMTGGYHGSWGPVMVGAKGADPPPGLTPAALAETLLLPFNDSSATRKVLEARGDEVAAIIVEPMLGSAGAIPATEEFLRVLRELADAIGALLIFDEIQTFRLAPGGAQELFGLRPDLTTFGKIIGGGLPIGAWGGRSDAMDLYDPRKPGAITHPGTFNGNALAMVAGARALELLTESEIDRINELGKRLRDGIEDAARTSGEAAVCVTGLGSMAQIHFTTGPVVDYASAAVGDNARRAAMHLALINEGVFTSPNCRFAVSTPMDERDIDRAITSTHQAFNALGESAPLGLS